MPNRIRFPRVFNNIQIQKYDNIGAICQLQFQRHSKNYNNNFVYFIHGNGNFVGITDTHIAYLLTNNQENNPSKQFFVDRLRTIADVDNVSSNDNQLIIKFNDNYEINIMCSTAEIVSTATKVIVSRSYYSNYCSNSSSMNKIASTDFSHINQLQSPQEKVLIPDGFYSIKNSNGKYVTNDKDYLPLIANRGTAKGWEKFKITNNDDGTISFLSVKNNKYVSVVGSHSKLRAKATKIARDEKFGVTKIGENSYNFLSMKNDKYVTVDRGKALYMYADRSQAKGWEGFELIPRE